MESLDIIKNPLDSLIAFDQSSLSLALSCTSTGPDDAAFRSLWRVYLSSSVTAGAFVSPCSEFGPPFRGSLLRGVSQQLHEQQWIHARPFHGYSPVKMRPGHAPR